MGNIAKLKFQMLNMQVVQTWIQKFENKTQSNQFPLFIHTFSSDFCTIFFFQHLINN